MEVDTRLKGLLDPVTCSGELAIRETRSRIGITSETAARSQDIKTKQEKKKRT